MIHSIHTCMTTSIIGEAYPDYLIVGGGVGALSIGTGEQPHISFITHH